MGTKKLPGEIVTFSARRDAYDLVEEENLYKKIMKILLSSSEPLTAREISTILFNKGMANNCDRQAVAPRLTELSQLGGVDISKERKYDPISGVNVTAYSIGVNYEEFL